MVKLWRRWMARLNELLADPDPDGELKCAPDCPCQGGARL
jgi:hypothetical protein